MVFVTSIAALSVGVIVLPARDPQETVLRTARVNVVSGDLPRRVDACGGGARRAWSVERGESAVTSAQETVTTVVSGDRPRRVDACGDDVLARAWSVEGGESAVTSAQETVKRTA